MTVVFHYIWFAVFLFLICYSIYNMAKVIVLSIKIHKEKKELRELQQKIDAAWIDNAFIDCVELALDWNLYIPEEDLKKYYELIKRRNEQNEMQSKTEIPKSK